MTSTVEQSSLDAVRFEHVGLVLGENRILDDVCARIPLGKCTAIVGPNGAGKTTLTLAVLGQVKCTGRIVFPSLEGAAGAGAGAFSGSVFFLNTSNNPMNISLSFLFIIAVC